jgi:predicted permease
MTRWTRRLRLLLHRDAVERAMDDELRHHLECEVADRVGAGMDPDEARRAALADFGSVDEVKEEARDARGTRALEDFVADVGYGARVLRRRPGFAIAAVLTFALGSGAATAIFSVVYGVLLRPLPYADAGRLVVLWERQPARGAERNVVSLPNFEAWRDRSRSFDGMAALVPSPVTLTGAGAPERLAGAEVSPGYFHLLGVPPALGRDFVPEDAGAHAHVVILSHGLWKRLGADPAVLGRTLQLGGAAHVVVGVMPAAFAPPQFGWLGTQELWLPFRATPEARSWGRFLLVVARLQEAVPLETARAEMAVLGDRLAHEARENEGWGVNVVPLAAQITGDVRTPLLVLQGAMGLLLVIAVTNVAALSLAQTQRRAPEFATRRLLGATDGRIFRQLFAQSALVAAAGAAIGALVARPAVRLLVAFAPAGLPRLDDIRVDTPVLLLTTAVALLATLAFGTVAARGSREGSTARMLVDAAGQRASSRGGGALATAEIGIALALGVMATLAARSFAGLSAVQLGFTTDGVVAARVALPDDGGTPARQRALFAAFLERVRLLPGIQSAALVTRRPFGGPGPATDVEDARPGADRPRVPLVADVRRVDADFFRTLGIPLVRGTTFSAGEPAEGPARVVISQSLCDALWPRADPIGRTLRLNLYGGMTGEVIGVAGDVHLADVRTPPRATAYLSDVRFPDSVRDLIVRFRGDPGTVAPSLGAALSAIAPGATVYQVGPLRRHVAASLDTDRFSASLLSALAGLALALSATGVFAVISSDMARRRKEIGIRMAVGARPRAVAAMLLREALARAAVGAAAGAALGLGLARLMKSLLFGVPPHDPLSFLLVSVVVAGVVVVATLVPAVRGLRASPLEALRES